MLRNIALEEGFGKAVITKSSKQPRVAIEMSNVDNSTDILLYYNKIMEISDRINQSREDTANLKLQQTKLINEVKTNTICDIEKTVDEQTLKLKNFYNQCKGELGTLKKELEEDNKGKQTPELRIRNNLYQMVNREFMDALDEFNENQHTHKMTVKTRVVRRLTTTMMMEETEANDLAENYAPQLSDIAISSTARDVVSRLTDRRDQALALERAFSQLYEMFNEFAVLVSAQQELLDTIESQVNSAQKYVAEGVEQLQKAEKLQKKSRKCTCWLVIIAAVILVIVLFVCIGVPLMTA
ncbi:Plasma membrane syntaxin [Monocercomonoides exilis]|uniref:Plasma membrane syntaxin n=1 Tax=Monocercomonoides exilis TaxID=2049356 RepID=UPI00355A5D33|nr:Plasma membrane syntaxin [Monocercomonoides exilis]|eukprot:MONOS_15659.1-p1 / transcript=MONOS_15659.1 / gene=MONOS_15659 / organism=Monocercomonoides_exilis_PA203 / gene_product= Plasma membrane syntaxin / transcript_product= Plasma membrane syntaxin / location=Mono_scaffold01301:2466-4272(+) / protein_length=297 / sequence_SO=supercontig / SO=protein_coding / is_pseudo=false